MRWQSKGEEMYKKPNTMSHQSGKEIPKISNELWKYFKRPFIHVLSKDIKTENGLYDKELYLRANQDVERDLKELLLGKSNNMQSVLGYTGIGKTHFLYYVLADYYNLDQFKSYKVYFPKSPDWLGKDDIVYCVSCEREDSFFKNDQELLMANQYNALCDAISEHYQITISDSELLAYIKVVKRSLCIFPQEEEEVKQKKRRLHLKFKLKFLLEKLGGKIANLVLVLDDIESLRTEVQRDLVEHLRGLYECLIHGKASTRIKVIYCMRSSTFSNILKASNDHASIWDTVRDEEPFHIRNPPVLSELFKRRFDFILDTDEDMQDLKARKTYEEARDVLHTMLGEVDAPKNSMLYGLANNSVPTAFEYLYRLLKNRRWTQRSASSSALYQNTTYDFNINWANVFRILFLDEDAVFFNQVKAYSVRSMFEKGGILIDDYTCLHIWNYFNLKYTAYKSTEDLSTKIVKVTDIHSLMNTVFSQEEISNNNIKSIVESTISYLAENEFIRTNDRILCANQVLEAAEEFYLRPKGRTIYENYMSTTILFEIFRDNFLFDDETYDIRPSVDLTQEELFSEYFKYLNSFAQFEIDRLKSLRNDEARLEKYKELIGSTILSEQLISAYENSVRRYYTFDFGLAKGLVTKTRPLRSSINNLKAEIGLGGNRV
jgi:hypothetical protein